MDKEVLNKFYDEMLALLNSAKGFALEQIPLIAKEILWFNFAEACIT